MTLIIIGLIVYAVCRASASVNNRRKEALLKTEANRIKIEQVRMREEWKARVAEAKIETDRMIAIEREQLRQAKELEKHEAQLAKHEEEIQKLKFRLSAAEADIDHWKIQIGNLYALLDIEQAEQTGAVPGSKADIKCQKRIITLTNQIHSAENRYNKAVFDKTFCEGKLAS